MSSNSPTSGMPSGYPSFSSFEKLLTPDRLAFLRSNSENLAFIKDLSAKLAKDPVFLKNLEAMLQESTIDLDQNQNAALLELASFGWSVSPDLPSPKAAAAAVGAAVGALVVPVPA